MEEFPGMTDKDPLEGLDAVGWAGLQHAYGPATDVPGLLRDLRAPDPERREKAVWELYGNIFHQGSRYEATAHAVPFLLALAADPGTPDRAEIVRMIAALAIGYDEAYLPTGVPVEEWRAEVAEMRTADPDEAYRKYDAWVAQAADDGERRSREFRRKIFDFEASRTAGECELAAYDAVRAGVPALCALLGDKDPALRAAAAYAVSWFPEESARALPGCSTCWRPSPCPASPRPRSSPPGCSATPHSPAGCGPSCPETSRCHAGRRRRPWPGWAWPTPK